MPRSLFAGLFAALLMLSCFLSPFEVSTQNASADSVPSWTRVFHMHDGTALSTSDYDWLNSSGPQNLGYLDYDSDGLLGVTIKKNLPSQRWRHFWVLYPAVGEDIRIQGDMTAHVWAASRDNESGSRMTVGFSDIAPGQWSDPDSWTSIASATVPLTGPVYSSFKLYNLTMPGVDYVLAQGHYLVMTIMRGDSINDGLLILYDNSIFDSTITLQTPDFISCDSAWTEDVSGTPRTLFSDQEQIDIVANISNPFGAYDILGAYYSVRYSSNGSVAVPVTSMTLESSSSDSFPEWKTFRATLPTIANDSYEIQVFAEDAQGLPSWMNISLTIVGVDHFSVSVPSRITAGEEFSVTVTALDSAGNPVPMWVGTVTLTAYKSDLSGPASGYLSVQSLVFTTADLGQVVITNQTYSSAEEYIRLRAESGIHTGMSGEIEVAAGAVVSVQLSPGSIPTPLGAGSLVSFTVIGTDSLGNINTTWSPVWVVEGGIGSLSGDEFSATFRAESVGSGGVNCSNPATSVYSFVAIEVVAGALSSIEISPAGPITIQEGQTITLSAVGYDSYGNTVEIDGAVWITNTSGEIVGTGSSIVFRAGFVPETGVVEVAVGAISDEVWVTITNSANGPWLSTIPPMIQTEDSNWTFSLATYWHHANGTSELRWHVEGVNTSLFIITHDTVSDASMRFYTQPDKYGTDTFRLWVRDPDGYSTYQDVYVSIQPVNDRPRFVNSPPTDIYVKFNMLYTFDYTYYVKDVDTDSADLLMTSTAPSNIAFDGLVASFVFPRIDITDEYFNITKLTVTDAPTLASSDSTNSDYLNIVVWVTDDTPPSLNESLPDIELNEGEINHVAFDLDDYFFDIDEERLYYISGFDPAIEIDIAIGSNIVYVSSPTEWSGTSEGTFTAKDPRGALKVDTVRITVHAVNDAPSVSGLTDVFVRYEAMYTMDASLHVQDPDHSISELTFTFDSLFVSYSFGSIVLLFPANLSAPVYSEPYRVVVAMTVSDPLMASVTVSFNVTVSDNYAPTVSSPAPYAKIISFPEDTPLNGAIDLNLLFHDEDDSTLDFHADGNRNIIVQIADGLVNFTAPNNWSGTERVVFTATDSHGAWASWDLTVVVIPVNDAPVVLPIPDTIVKGGPRNSHYLISGYFIDSETPFSQLTIFASPTANVAVVGSYLYVSLPDGVDVVTVSIFARDSDGADSNTVTFKVGVSKTTAQIIGYPYSFPLVLMAAGIGAYFLAQRIPRPYAVENVFLIHNDGRLIAHVTKEENTSIDKDVVSAMFTAVQEFVRDSFQQGEVGLKKLEIGNKNVVIEKGSSAYIAMIYSGWPPKEVFANLTMLLRDIEERYKGRIEKWNGTLKSLKGVEQMLHIYVSGEFKPGYWQAEEEIMGEEEWVQIIDKEA